MLSKEQIEKFKDWLHATTRIMTDELLASFKKEPSIMGQYSEAELRPMAEQGVIAFRDILLGALEFDAPFIVSKEMGWLDALLKSRNVDGERVQIFYDLLYNRIRADIAPEDAQPFLNFLEETKKFQA
jgi:hypothetical protein